MEGKEPPRGARLKLEKLAINEFDQQLRSAVNFSDPESFKALILPLGLEELRVVTAYEVMNLQALVVAVRTNQV